MKRGFEGKFRISRKGIEGDGVRPALIERVVASIEKERRRF